MAEPENDDWPRLINDERMTMNEGNIPLLAWLAAEEVHQRGIDLFCDLFAWCAVT
jgi:hypothetical protein